MSKINAGILIGSGAYGKVYKNTNKAIKISGEDDFDYAIKEVAIMKYLRTSYNYCANIIQCDKVTLVDHQFYNTEMPYFNYNLEDFLKKYTSFSETIAAQLITAVYYMHRMNVIHNDIKPANILINFANCNNSEINVVLCDFNISSIKLEKVNGFVQSLNYRAPEIVEENKSIEYNPIIDMWSVGCIMFEMISLSPLMGYYTSSSSSIIICKIFGLRVLREHDRRIKMLNIINRRDVKDVLHEKLGGKLTTLPPWYRKIMSRCLIPNIDQRIDSCAAYRMIPTDLLPGKILASQPLEIKNTDHQIGSYFSALDGEIVSNYGTQTIWFAKQLHLKISEKYKTELSKYFVDSQMRIQLLYSCLFIAVAICGIPSPEYIDCIKDAIKPVSMIDIVDEILQLIGYDPITFIQD